MHLINGSQNSIFQFPSPSEPWKNKQLLCTKHLRSVVSRVENLERTAAGGWDSVRIASVYQEDESDILLTSFAIRLLSFCDPIRSGFRLRICSQKRTCYLTILYIYIFAIPDAHAICKNMISRLHKCMQKSLITTSPLHPFTPVQPLTLVQTRPLQVSLKQIKNAPNFWRA